MNVQFTISLRFLGIFSRVLRFEVSNTMFTLQNMQFQTTFAERRGGVKSVSRGDWGKLSGDFFPQLRLRIQPQHFQQIHCRSQTLPPSNVCLYDSQRHSDNFGTFLTRICIICKVFYLPLWYVSTVTCLFVHSFSNCFSRVYEWLF